MLHFIREHAQGWIAWIIVGLLIIPFALWGINEYFGNGGKLVAATVNDTEIDQREFQQAFYEQRGRMQEMLGGQYDSRVFDPQLRKRVIGELIERELLLQNADSEGYRVSDQSVLATIQSFEVFREDGAFSSATYRQQLRAQGQSPAAFERRIKRALLASQLPSGIAGTEFVSDAELDAIIRLQGQQRDVAYLTLSLKQHENAADATEEAVTRYYEDHRDRYLTQEKVNVEYLELAASELGQDEEPDEKTLREFYQSRSNLFVVPEERHVRHILVQIEAGAGDDPVAAARKKAEDLLQRIRNGEAFATLAKANSDDPGSAEQGGDLGFIGRGTMEPDFEQAAFSLKEGEVSEPVLTSFGYHLIKVEAIRTEQAKPFEVVRKELLKEYQQDAAERKYFELADKLTNLAYETPDSLQEVANRLGLTVKESGFFGRAGGKGIFANPGVIAAAFSDEVLKQGYNSEPIEVGENHVVVLRFKAHQPAAERPLEEVMDSIKQQLIAEKARERAQAAASDKVKRLTEGTAMEVVAQDAGAEWQKPGLINRDAVTPDRAIVQQAFKLKRPTDSAASYGSVALPSGDVAIVAVSKVIDGDPSSVAKEEREKLRGELLNLRGAEASQAVLDELKAKARIAIQIDES